MHKPLSANWNKQFVFLQHVIANLQPKNNKKQKETGKLIFFKFVICHMTIDIDKTIVNLLPQPSSI